MICRQDEIDLDIEVQLEENQGFVDNAQRGTAHMFRLEFFLHKVCSDVNYMVKFGSSEMSEACCSVSYHTVLFSL